jgi:hypothetical protein
MGMRAGYMERHTFDASKQQNASSDAQGLTSLHSEPSFLDSCAIPAAGDEISWRAS